MNDEWLKNHFPIKNLRDRIQIQGTFLFRSCLPWRLANRSSLIPLMFDGKPGIRKMINRLANQSVVWFSLISLCRRVCRVLALKNKRRSREGLTSGSTSPLLRRNYIEIDFSTIGLGMRRQKEIALFRLRCQK